MTRDPSVAPRDAGDGAGGDPPRLFVYGTLRRGQQNPMAALLHRHSRHLGRGTVCARLYAVGGYTAMGPGESPDECVRGDVFELDAEAAERVLAALDAYEGDGYVRRTMEVAMEDETRVRSLAYLYAASVAGLPRVAQGE
ncbi:MAG TPA: gamma-glutamylcyclotransferase family protein [Longimicrobium sp.]|nr:gamma-glutamylcyclotransferase family protein [Longimicrobium sp.]